MKLITDVKFINAVGVSLTTKEATETPRHYKVSTLLRGSVMIPATLVFEEAESDQESHFKELDLSKFTYTVIVNEGGVVSSAHTVPILTEQSGSSDSKQTEEEKKTEPVKRSSSTPARAPMARSSID